MTMAAQSSADNVNLLSSSNDSESAVVEVHKPAEDKTTDVNVSEKIAPGEKELEKDDGGKKEGNSISNIKIESGLPRKKRSFIKSKIMRKKKPTLLEQAQAFREQNPEKWQQRLEDNERRVNESYGVFDEDPFIEAYYERLAELNSEGEKLEEQRRHAVSRYILQKNAVSRFMGC